MESKYRPKKQIIIQYTNQVNDQSSFQGIRLHFHFASAIINKVK